MGITAGPPAPAAALVALWLLALSLHLARPYMVANLHKFTLRLGADLWWIVYVALRDLLLVQVFLGIAAYYTRLQAAEIPLAMVLTTVAHVATGGLTLAASISLSIQIRRNVRAQVASHSQAQQAAVIS